MPACRVLGSRLGGAGRGGDRAAVGGTAPPTHKTTPPCPTTTNHPTPPFPTLPQISDEEELTLIDFPQMVSTSHANAEELFERDVDGVTRFFERKLGYLPEGDEALERVRPSFADALAQAASQARRS